MELACLLHIADFEPKLDRFRSCAFDNSSDGGGISVIQRECILKESGCVCSHFRKFYSSIISEPVLFFVFSPDELPPGWGLKQEPSTSGDICHHNVTNLSDNKAKKFFKRKNWKEFFACNGNEIVCLSDAIISGALKSFNESQ